MNNNRLVVRDIYKIVELRLFSYISFNVIYKLLCKLLLNLVFTNGCFHYVPGLNSFTTDVSPDKSTKSKCGALCFKNAPNAMTLLFGTVALEPSHDIQPILFCINPPQWNAFFPLTDIP